MKLGDANIALMMIVKNEGRTLPRLIESVRPLISSWRIIDTGSTDNTRELINELLGDLPGELIESPWVSFGHNRSELVSTFPANADYALLLDADQLVELQPDALVTQIPDAEFLMIPVYEAPVLYRMPYFIKAGLNARYVGATHEYITASPEPRRAEFDAIRINHLADGGAKSDKYVRDEKLLMDDIAAGNNTSRNHFYLGQTQYYLQKFDEALSNYRIAFETSAWIEERYLSCLRAGRVAVEAGKNDVAVEWFLRGAGVITNRPECSYEAAVLMEKLGAYQTAVDLLQPQIERMTKTGFILFIEDWIYDWGIDNQLAVSLWWVGKRNDAKKIFEELLTRPSLPPHMVERVRANISKC